MNNKLNELYQYSDPDEVNKRAMELHLNPIHPSSRKDKKYMVFNGTRMVQFGQMGYEDYTKHHDERRQINFKKRNHKWANRDVYSPAWLSYNLLW